MHPRKTLHSVQRGTPVMYSTERKCGLFVTCPLLGTCVPHGPAPGPTRQQPHGSLACFPRDRKGLGLAPVHIQVLTEGAPGPEPGQEAQAQSCLKTALRGWGGGLPRPVRPQLQLRPPAEGHQPSLPPPALRFNPQPQTPTSKPQVLQNPWHLKDSSLFAYCSQFISVLSTFHLMTSSPR